MGNKANMKRNTEQKQPSLEALEHEGAVLKDKLAEVQKLLNWHIEQFKPSQQRQHGRKTESFADGSEQMTLLDADDAESISSP
jgi:hypothetical protein